MAGITRTRESWGNPYGDPYGTTTSTTGSYTNTSIPSTNKTSTRLGYVHKVTTDVVNNRYWYWRPAGYYYQWETTERQGFNPAAPLSADAKYASQFFDEHGGMEKKFSKRRLAFRWRDNNFDSFTTTNYVGVIEGTRSDNVRKFLNYPCDYDPGAPAVDTEFPLPTTAEINAAALKALEKSNPSTAAVNIPTFMVELRDFPALVQQWGLHHLAKKGEITKQLRAFLNPRNLKTDGPIRKVGTYVIGPKDVWDARQAVKNLGRTAAQSFLTWQWVIKPTIGELRILTNFFVEVQKRLQIIRDLKTYGRYSQRVFVGSVAYDKVESPGYVALQSWGALVYADKVVHYSKKEWCSVDWEVQDMDSFPSAAGDQLKLALRTVTGVNTWAHLQTAWELFPWSWAIDWMFGVGKFLAATNNNLQLKYKNICYMRSTSAHARYKRRTDLAVSDQWARLKRHPYQRAERKLRRVQIGISNPFPVRLQPFLTGRAWSILGSLKILEEIKDESTFLKFKPKKGFPIS